MTATSTSRPRGPRRPGPRGWAVPGGARPGWLQPPPEFRGTTVQVCGLWPWATGAGAPMVGVPVGRHLVTGATVCMDPISWFMRSNLISNPSMFTLGRPGLGKSSLTRRLCLGLAGYGVVPMVLGDLRPDYVDLIRALGGQVIETGPGRSTINVLDPGEATAAAKRLTGRARDSVLADTQRRRLTMLTALLTISRRTSPSDNEVAILDRALRVLDDRLTAGGQVPILPDVYQVIEDAPDNLRQIVIDRGDQARYREATRALQMSLVALLHGPLGDMFAGHTTQPMSASRPVAFNVSSISETDTDLQAAALMACWSTGFATVNVANVLSKAGLEPQRRYFIVLDELWRALRAGAGMVDRVDMLTRLNRKFGVGQSMISHTMSDLEALPTQEDRMKARGFVERAGIVVAGGLPKKEMPLLDKVIHFSDAEADLVASWSTPPAWKSGEGRPAPPPGRGKFLIKVGERPGIPIQTVLTACETQLNDTNALWHASQDVDERLDDALTVEPGEQEWA